MKKFAAFDIDGTLIRWQLYHDIVDYLGVHGAIDPDKYEKVQHARQEWKQRTHHDAFGAYEIQLVRAYHDLLPNLNLEQFNKAAEAAVEENKKKTYTFTCGLLDELKAKGYFLLAISGSPHEAVAKISDYYEFDDFVGAQYEHIDGRFTGGRKLMTVGRKDEVLQSLIDKHQLDRADSYAIGDSGGDIGMLKMVDNPIAFNPDKKLFAAAKEHGWQVVIERKNMIYRLKPHHGSFLLA